MVARDDTEGRLTEEDAHVGAATPRRRSNPRPQQGASQASVDERLLADEELGEDETADDVELTDDERFAIFQDSAMNSVLPDLPSDPLYHNCWVSMTNGRDTPQMRMRLGYEFIRTDEAPGWQLPSSPGTAQYPGTIQINEMIAMRIRKTLYLRYMNSVHHTRPLGEEEKIRANVDAMRDEAERAGGRLVEGDGMPSIVQRARAPEGFA